MPFHLPTCVSYTLDTFNIQDKLSLKVGKQKLRMYLSLSHYDVDVAIVKRNLCLICLIKFKTNLQCVLVC